MMAQLQLIAGLAACAVLTAVIMIPILGISPLLIVVGLLWLLAKSS
jgi:hypothetical protein